MRSKMLSGGVLGAIIAGGRSQRMGVTSKMASALAGRPILRHIVDRLGPQVERIVLNANSDPALWEAYDVEVVPDAVGGHQGPLAGLLTMLDWAGRQVPACAWVVAVPSDTPFLPRDLLFRLESGLERYDDAWAVVAQSAGRLHPVTGLFSVRLADNLRGFLDAGERKAGAWIDWIGAPAVSFPAEPVDPFFNINTPEDLAEAERLHALIDRD